MAADLHCHTVASDGSALPEEVVMMAKKRGLSAVAITDHDTFLGVKAAEKAGAKYGIQVLPGAEFSSRDAETGRKAHILCYFCEQPEKLEDLCKKICDARRKAGEAMLEKVLELFPIPAEMVWHEARGSASLYKQHIMRALMNAGYAHEVFGSVFHELFSPDGGKAYVKVEYPEVHDVIEQIHRAGGLAVLAHPGEYDSYRLLEELAMHRTIDGVEVWHSRNKAGDEERFFEIAQENGLAMTGGTDFHGLNTKKPMPIGTCTVSDAQLNALFEISYHNRGGH
ncbi:MAG: Phosphoribosyl 1,2-cyclic phosphate 1,2-diphosphodiesterase [Thermocaproicibacter melissae]|jgi:phosphoribosyl 1,2-cyclic phosphate 1,2-diphosphodiesterase|uniref:PHP domain-containing protein n=1 Tax=Thermocaproicibacter melissae TaxID=2966552 RepID=UPI0024B0DF20|nr:PHP domain-containing protein [Thermocaproicibacter melissae]WBY64888.1 PHP domain-containing protein [Thermocaproicibacter melissae]